MRLLRIRCSILQVIGNIMQMGQGQRGGRPRPLMMQHGHLEMANLDTEPGRQPVYLVVMVPVGLTLVYQLLTAINTALIISGD